MDKTTAYNLGYAMRLGMEYAKNNLARDGAEWRTFKPNGQENKGRKVLIDAESGQILGGSIPQSIRGANIKELRNKFKEQKTAKQNTNAITAQASTNQNATSGQNKSGKTLDLSLPDKIDEKMIIQNRNRTSKASQQQIKDIAENLDYDMVSSSKSIANGAPVISYGTYSPECLGRVTKMVANDHTKYQVQYAVVEADDVLTSNREDGQINEEYYSNDATKKRAIAGNGRLAGIQYAYNQQNNAVGSKFGKNIEQYKKDLMEDDEHGIKPDVIAKMKKPVLVRVMQPKDITSDIGDKSNTQSQMQMSLSEQAANDCNRVNLEEIDLKANGKPTKEYTLKFIHSMPISEQGNLISRAGNPTTVANSRLQAAIFQKAYNDENLTAIATEEPEDDNRVILNALNIAAPAMVNLSNVKDGYDIRGLVSKVASQAVNFQSQGYPLKDFELYSDDLFETEQNNNALRAFRKLIAKNSNSPRALGNKLKNLAIKLKQESDQDGTADLFGAHQTKTPEELIKETLAEDAIIKKMSTVMANFWRKQGNRFFDDVTCDAFIAELKQYRKDIKKP